MISNISYPYYKNRTKNKTYLHIYVLLETQMFGLENIESSLSIKFTHLLVFGKR